MFWANEQDQLHHGAKFVDWAESKYEFITRVKTQNLRNGKNARSEKGALGNVGVALTVSMLSIWTHISLHWCFLQEGGWMLIPTATRVSAFTIADRIGLVHNLHTIKIRPRSNRRLCWKIEFLSFRFMYMLHAPYPRTLSSNLTGQRRRQNKYCCSERSGNIGQQRPTDGVCSAHYTHLRQRRNINRFAAILSKLTAGMTLSGRINTYKRR